MEKPVITGNTIKVPTDAEFLSDVDMFIEGILRGYGADESVVADIAISVSELVNNAINHGNKGVFEKPIVVTISHSDRVVEISITDQGKGFDPSKIADPIADENLLKEVGRGLFIVKSLMNSIEVKLADGSTSVVITKTIQ